MDMDIYKVSLVSIGLSIMIVVTGVVLGMNAKKANLNAEILLSSPKVTQSDKQSEEENQSNLDRQVPDVVEEPYAINLNGPQSAFLAPIQKNPSMAMSVFLTFTESDLSKVDMSSLLRDLKIIQVNATFFISGETLEKSPEIWRSVVLDGHHVCNLTYSGNAYETQSGLELVEDILKWEQVAAKILGRIYIDEMKNHFPFFRFPNDEASADQVYLNAVQKSGYRAFGSSISTKDREDSSVEAISISLYEEIARQTQGGDVVDIKLAHTSVVYLRQMLTSLVNQNYRIRKLAEGFTIQ